MITRNENPQNTLASVTCPYCSEALQEGYVISNGARLLFSFSKRKIEYSPDEKGEVLLDRHRLGSYVSAHHCPNCKKIIIHY